MEKVRQSNEACQRGDFQEAVCLYGDALQADPQNCILYSNRSAAFLKLGQHQAALEDAEKACGLNPKWPKVRIPAFLFPRKIYEYSCTFEMGRSHIGDDIVTQMFHFLSNFHFNL
uniref:Uncharacterized protein n=1 Tax=Xiphophorus couchianus TaxID=32473 RepID=A0A3B5MNP0_9TELE